MLPGIGRAPRVTLSAGCAAAPAASLPGAPAPSVASRQPQKASPAATRLRADLTQVFAAPIMARGVWGVDIRSLETGEHLYELNAGRLMMPASNMKIVTLAAAADVARLGLPVHHDARDDRHRRSGTSSRATSSSAAAAIRRSTRARDAPRRCLDEWAAALRAAGIQQIDGADRRRRPALRRRGHRRGVGVGLPAVRLRRARRRAAVQREPRDADGHARRREAGAPATVALTAGAGLADR